MSWKGYDVFFAEPDSVKEMHCRVCQTLCMVERNVVGPTGSTEAMFKRGHWHDVFRCPHSDKSWHEEAVELFRSIEETPSDRLASLMQQDLDDLLRKNGGL